MTLPFSFFGHSDFLGRPDLGGSRMYARRLRFALHCSLGPLASGSGPPPRYALRFGSRLYARRVHEEQALG